MTLALLKFIQLLELNFKWCSIECNYYNYSGRHHDQSSNDISRNHSSTNNDRNDDYC